MNNKLLTYLSLLIIALFIGYIILDSVKPSGNEIPESTPEIVSEEKWHITNELVFNEGTPCAVAISPAGTIYVGGDSFISAIESGTHRKIWTIATEMPVTSLSADGDLIYASTRNHLIIVDSLGTIKGELGPWEENSIITSVAAGPSTIAVADAYTKFVYIIDKGGEVLEIFGNDADEFIVPSPYFDVVNSTSGYYIANTGKRRIEKRDENGAVISFFGESGLAPEAFCGCCNPAHFTSFPGGFITAEKGINRIKVIDSAGRFVEFVSAKNNFKPSVPLDIAADGDKAIYAVNPADSRLYIFKRKT